MAKNTMSIFDAIQTGNRDEVKEVIEKNPKAVEEKNGFGSTPLSEAVKINNFSIIDLLVGSKADINERGDSGNTPLITAIQYNYFDLAKELVKMGGKPNIKSSSGNDAYFFAMDRCNQGLIDFLNEWKAEHNDDAVPEMGSDIVND